MFRNKIARFALLVVLYNSLPVLANEISQENKILIERATYWDKLGRSDMAVQAWQQLLLTEPDNAQALAAIARYQAQSLAAQSEFQVADIAESESSAVQDGSGLPAESAEAVPLSEPEVPVRKVEDWTEPYLAAPKQNAAISESAVGAGQADASATQALVDHTLDTSNDTAVASDALSLDVKDADTNNPVVVAPPLNALPEAGAPAEIAEPQADKIENNIVDTHAAILPTVPENAVTPTVIQETALPESAPVASLLPQDQAELPQELPQELPDTHAATLLTVPENDVTPTAIQETALPESTPVASLFPREQAELSQELPDTPAATLLTVPENAVTPAAIQETALPESAPVASLLPSEQAELPQELPDTQGLVARAQYWEKVGRSDMAVQSWQQLLLVDPDNAQAQAGLARYQGAIHVEQAKPTNHDASEVVANGEVVVSGEVAQDIHATVEATAVAASEPAQRVTQQSVVAVQPEGDARKVEDWADLYQSGLKESVLTAEPNASAALQADGSSSTPAASAIAMENVRIEQAVEQPVAVAPKALDTASNAINPTAPETLPRKVATIAPPLTTPAVQAEKWPEFYQRGFKPVLPEPDIAPTSGGSLLLSDQPSRQELLDQAQYWDSRGRTDLSAKIRKELAPVEQPAVVVSNKPVVTATEMADKPRFTVSSMPETQAASVVTERVAAIKAAENTPAAESQQRVTLEENVQALVARPSKQESLDRAQYWEERGRSDLAAKVPNQPVLLMTEQGDTVLSKNSVASKRIAIAEKVIARNDSAGRAQAGMPEPGTALPAAPLSQKELDEQAAYWEARGRTDLADKARPAPGIAGTGRDAAARIAAADRQMSLLATDDPVQGKFSATGNARTLGSVAPTRAELDEQAQYWEDRGRSDLADQLRKKLYALEPAHPASQSRRTAPVQALHATKTRDNEDARSALEDSLLKNPGSMSARLDLARIYQSAGEMAKARLQIDSVLAKSPDLPDALYASAQLYATQRLWWETLHTLDKISPVSRTTEMGKLQKMAWAHVQIDRADALVRQGNNAEAELLLRQVAAELAVNYNQTRQPEPPPLWKSAAPKAKKSRR